MAQNNTETNKIVIKASDMDEDMLKKVQEVAFQAVNQNKFEKQMSHYFKYEFDKFEGLGWNCVVGRNFGSQITHQTKKYVFFSMRELNFLLWKA